MIARTDGILTRAERRAALALAAAGAAAIAVGVSVAPVRAWAAVLAGAYFFLTLALGAAALLALFYLTGAGWSAVVKRPAEALAAWLPGGAATLLVVLLGAETLYPWAAAPELSKGGWLALTPFALRMALFLVVWIAFARSLRRVSLRQDAQRDLSLARRAVALSAAFVPVLGVTFSLASIDWLMSLEPRWSSTLFGFYNLGGLLVGGTAALTAAVVFLRRRGLLPCVNESHLHDLGKLLFAFSTLWAYLWFSQYMLIWYGNIPEEAGWYSRQLGGGWAFLFWANLVIGWALPFAMLLPRSAKRDEASLLRASAVLLAAHWLDVYLMVGPAVMPEHPGIGPIELGAFAAVGGLFVMAVERATLAAPLLPLGDPFLVESLHHH